MHELGHALWRKHGGSDETNNKPNYLSVMNYAFEACSVPVIASASLPGGCDYSRLALPEPEGQLDETSLDECHGFGALFGPIDFDGRAGFQGASCGTENVSADVNGDRFCILAGDDMVLASKPANDDVVEADAITTGGDRTCDTAPQGDDQFADDTEVGSARPTLLPGVEDWNELNFIMSSSARDEVTGATPEQILQARQSLEQLTLPVLQASWQGPNVGLPGDVLSYAFPLSSVGRGPALAVDAMLIDPLDGATYSIGAPPDGMLRALEASSLAFQYTVPDARTASRLQLDVRVEFQGLAGFAHTVGSEMEIDRPPSCEAGGPYVVECRGAVTQAQVDGTRSDDLDSDPLTFLWTGPFSSANASIAQPMLALGGLGTRALELNVSDGTASTRCGTSVSVVDRTPPTIVTTSTQELWPPNGRYETLDLTSCVQSVVDVCAGSLPVATSTRVIAITSNEVGTGRDFEIVGATRFRLRVKRDGGGQGRTYKVAFDATDPSGNISKGVCDYKVPHDQR
jgi:hypothetical protein